MAEHYHLATVVKISPDLFDTTPHSKFPCLYKLKDNSENQLEELLLYKNDYTKDEKNCYKDKFFLADFHYLDDKRDINRCKVLCPIYVNNNWHIHGENIYKVKLNSIEPIVGKTGCSPKGYAYFNNGIISTYSIKDLNKCSKSYAAMFCFPDLRNTSTNSYFAFCEIKDFSKIDLEWAHEDDPNYNEIKDDKGNVTSYTTRKDFTCHNIVKPFFP